MWRWAGSWRGVGGAAGDVGGALTSPSSLAEVRPSPGAARLHPLDVGAESRGPVPTGEGICGPEVEQGTMAVSQPASGVHCPDGSGRAGTCMAFLLESAEIPPLSARGGHPSRARPAHRGLAAWPGGTPRPTTCPPPWRQPPTPGARTTCPAVWPGALQRSSLRGRLGVGAEGGSPAQARAVRGRGCLNSARSFPHAGPPCSSSWSIHLLRRGAGRRGLNLDSREVWVLME